MEKESKYIVVDEDALLKWQRKVEAQGNYIACLVFFIANALLSHILISAG